MPILVHHVLYTSSSGIFDFFSCGQSGMPSTPTSQFWNEVTCEGCHRYAYLSVPACWHCGRVFGKGQKAHYKTCKYRMLREERL